MGSKAYKSDSEAAKKAVYASKGQGQNPYEEGTRRHRLWIKWKRHFDNMESYFDDMAEAYGEWRPDKLNLKN